MHTTPTYEAKDTLEERYDRRGNKISSVLVSQFDKNGLGMPIIVRERFDNQDRLVSHNSYAFSFDNGEKKLMMRDTATVLMDTMIISYSYSDTCNVKRMQFWTNAFGYKELEQKEHYTYLDSLGRITKYIVQNEEGVKQEEKVHHYSKNIITSITKKRHRDGRLYYHVLDTIFLDTAGIAIKKSIDRLDKSSKNKPWRKCHDCWHLYERDDSSNIVRTLYQEYSGRQLREELYTYVDNKVSTKTSRAFGVTSKDSVRLESYFYDKMGTLIYWETKKRDCIDFWQRRLVKYAVRQDPVKK